MLVLYIFILMFVNSINNIQKNIHSTYINRITILTLFITIIYTYNTLYFQEIGKGISIYSGLFQITVQSQIVEVVLISVGISILIAWPFLLDTEPCNGAFEKTGNILSSGSSTSGSGASPAFRSVQSNVGQAQGNNTTSLSLSALIKKISDRTETNKESADNIALTGQGNDTRSALVINVKTSDQYSLIAIFSILGGSLLMSSLDLLSMYLSIELQSFSLYILATLNKERLSATSAGLKYFLLGSLSSCFILLGSAIIYSYTGLTQFESINSLMSLPNFFLSNSSSAPLEMWDINKAFTIGIIILIIGFLFKISAAPFYQWAPDVYDGTPTIVTVWLTIVVKLTILIFLLGFVEYTFPDSVNLNSFIYESLILPKASALQETNIYFNGYIMQALVDSNLGIGQVQIKNLLLISSLLSLIIGTIAGLSQIKFKRLLAFSSISHVGFLLLALGIYTQKSVDSFLFYLIQYSITSLNIFLILLAFSYFMIYPYYKDRRLHKQKAFAPAFTLPGDKHLNKDISENTTKVLTLEDLTQSLYFINGRQLLNTHQATTGQELIQENIGSPTDINYIMDLKGQLYQNPVLSISMAICLFSMAGVPPLIGFFSKQFVLFSSIENGNNFLSIVAILVSVISASYYLRLIKFTFFDSLPCYAPEQNREENNILESKMINTTATQYSESKVNGNGQMLSTGYEVNYGKEMQIIYIFVSSIHSYIISALTLFILFFFLDPSILLNGTQLISLTIFNI
jgi:NADH-ubiquinone oxidoreductase chain 2